MFTQIKQWLEPPQFDGDEEKTAQARVLNTLLVNLGIALLLGIFVLVPFFVIQKINVWILLTVIFCGIVIGRHLLFRGQFRLSITLLVSITWLCFFFLTLFSGGSSSPAMFYLASVTLVAGFVLSPRAANGLTILTILVMLGIADLQNRVGVMLPTLFVFTPLTGWLAFGLGLAFMSSARNLFVRTLENALALARQEIAQRKQAEETLKKSEEWSRTLFEKASDGIFYLSMNGELVEVNHAFARMHGYRAEEMQKMNLKDFETPETSRQFPERMRRTMAGEVFTFEVEHYHKDGHTFPLEVTASVIAVGNEKYFLAFHRDITERKQTETHNRITAKVQDILLHPCELKDIYGLVSEKIKELIGDGITATSMLDEKHRIVRMGSYHGINIPMEKVLSILGIDSRQMEFSLDDMTKEDLRVYRSGRLEILEGGLHTLMTRLVPKPACLIVEKLLRVQKIYAMGFIHKNEHLGALFVLARGDITPHIAAIEQIVNLGTIAIERKRAQEALRESEERLASIFNTTGDSMFLLDVGQDDEYQFNSVNPAFLATTGLPAESVVGRNVKEIIPEPSLALVLGKYSQAIQEKTIVRWEETSDYPTGTLTALVTIAPILDAAGTCQQLVGNVHDITGRKLMEDQLRYQSTHDILTGIYNRAFFEEELARLERSREFPVSVIVADVDKLKITNDTLGHAAGDELIRHTANVLRSVFRAADVLARIGGDEFAILLPNTDAVTAEHLLSRVRAKLVEHNAQHPGLPVQVSLGAATAEKNNLTAAFTLADQRMYADKATHTSRENDAPAI